MLTKHYFAGSHRIASNIVDAGDIFNDAPTSSTTSQQDADRKDKQSAIENEFKNYLKKAGLEGSEIDTEFARNSTYLTGVYHLHGDHLGTATYVTNEIAEPTQFFLNLPFGDVSPPERWTELHPHFFM